MHENLRSNDVWIQNLLGSPSRVDGTAPVRVAPYGDGSTVEQAAIAQHLRANADQYLPRWSDDSEVVFLRLRNRPAARMYWYRLGNHTSSRTLVIKVPGEPADSGQEDQLARPRMLEPPPLDTKYAHEHQALQLLQRHFSELDDPRFGVIPLLGRIEPARAIVMGEIAGRSLKELIPRLSRVYPGPPPPLLRRAIRNTGAWLREYHHLEPSGAVPRHPRREDFVDNVQRYCSHLGAVLSRHPVFDGLAEQLTRAARRFLPPELPVGLAHGDFAMRNVLVGQAGRIFVFDTTAMWRTPIYADLAKFALAIRLSRVQVYSHGAAFSEGSLRQVNRWLFDGYYGREPVPEERIRLYALLLLLDKWSFELALPRQERGFASMIQRRLLDSWYTTQTRLLARQLV